MAMANNGEVKAESITETTGKPKKKKGCLIFIIAIVFIIALFGCIGGGDNSSTDTSNTAEIHLYDNAVIEDVKNGTGDKVIGQYAYIKTTKDKVNEETLADLYFNFVEQNDFNWVMIVYEDDEPYGTYINSGVIEEHCIVEHEEGTGQYIYGGYDEENGKIYVPNSEDKTVKLLED